MATVISHKPYTGAYKDIFTHFLTVQAANAKDTVEVPVKCDVIT